MPEKRNRPIYSLLDDDDNVIGHPSVIRQEYSTTISRKRRSIMDEDDDDNHSTVSGATHSLEELKLREEEIMQEMRRQNQESRITPNEENDGRIEGETEDRDIPPPPEPPPAYTEHDLDFHRPKKMNNWINLPYSSSLDKTLEQEEEEEVTGIVHVLKKHNNHIEPKDVVNGDYYNPAYNTHEEYLRDLVQIKKTCDTLKKQNRIRADKSIVMVLEDYPYLKKRYDNPTLPFSAEDQAMFQEELLKFWRLADKTFCVRCSYRREYGHISKDWSNDFAELEKTIQDSEECELEKRVSVLQEIYFSLVAHSLPDMPPDPYNPGHLRPSHFWWKSTIRQCLLFHRPAESCTFDLHKIGFYQFVQVQIMNESIKKAAADENSDEFVKVDKAQVEQCRRLDTSIHLLKTKVDAYKLRMGFSKT